MRPISFIVSLAVALMIATTEIVRAHVTPPVEYLSDRDAIRAMTADAAKHAVREVKLTPDERRTIEAQSSWKADEPVYRFYLGRDEQGRLVSAVTFLTDVTIHGPLRIAVAFAPNGKVKDVRLIEAALEMSAWVRPLAAGGFLQRFVGLDSRADFAAVASGAMPRENMSQFFADIVAALVQRGAVLFDVAFRQRGEM